MVIGQYEMMTASCKPLTWMKTTMKTALLTHLNFFGALPLDVLIKSNKSLCQSPLVIATFTLFFGGCAANMLNVPNPTESAYITSGKLVVIQPQQRSSAHFRWLHEGDRFQMELWGPLGSGRTLIAGTSEFAKITQGKTLIDKGRPLEIMQRRLGWSAPIDVFPHWIKGNVADSEPIQSSANDAQGRIMHFEQLGWLVSFSDYMTFQDASAPRRIELIGPNLQLRFIIGSKQRK